MHIGWNLHPGYSEKRRCEIGVEGEAFCHGAGFHAGSADDERDVEARFIHEAFIVHPEVAEVPAVVGAINDYSISGEVVAVEVVEHLADAVIDALDTREVVLHIALVFPLDKFAAGEGFLAAVRERDLDLGGLYVQPLLALRSGREISRRRKLEIAVGEIVGDRLPVFRECGGAGGVIVPERGGFRNDLVGEEGAVLFVGLPTAMGRLLVEHQEERLVLRARIQKLETETGGDLGGVALDGDAAMRGEEIRVLIDALAGKNDPAIEPGGVGPEMPFSDHAGVIAGGLQHLRDGWLRTVEHIEDGCAVGVGILAGEHDGATRGADRVGDEGVIETHPPAGETIQVRRLIYLGAVGADRVLGVIIGKDEKNIGTRRRSEERGAEKGVNNENERGAEFHGAKEV